MKYLLSTMKTTQIYKIVAKSTIRTERFFRPWHIFRITVKTFLLLTRNRGIGVINSVVSEGLIDSSLPIVCLVYYWEPKNLE